MINLKDITKLPELTDLDGTEKVILNVNGSAHQAAVSLVKPADEWDLDIEIVVTFVSTDDQDNGDMDCQYTVHCINSFENIKNKILSGVQPKCKAKVSSTGFGNTNSSLRYTESFSSMVAVHYPAYDAEGVPEHIRINGGGLATCPYIVLLPDNTIAEVGDDY